MSYHHTMEKNFVSPSEVRHPPFSDSNGKVNSMNVDAKILERVEGWALDYVDNARKRLGPVYEENRDYVDERLLDGLGFLQHLFWDCAPGMLSKKIAGQWEDYKSSGLEESLTLEEFASVKKTIAKNRV